MDHYDVYSDTWCAVDALGRKVPGHAETGGPRPGKFVGIFYWTWHIGQMRNAPVNVSEVLAKWPEANTDPDHPAWGPPYTGHFWGEPLFGYYTLLDKWIARRHAEMLADAGVDAVFFDCTNGRNLFKPAFEVLCEAWEEARRDGVKTPQFVFMLGFRATDDALAELEDLYTTYYKPGRYKDLWFHWKGKPLVCAIPDRLTDGTGGGGADKAALHAEIADFFTFRSMQTRGGRGPDPKRTNQWAWNEIYPQNLYNGEEMSVGVAQNIAKGRPLWAMNAPGVFGRDYTGRFGHITHKDAYKYGYNFQEQWDHALAHDPEFIFVTGWNEWIAGRFPEWEGTINAFPDQGTTQNSRDIEPMKGGYGDSFYMQFVGNVRRFKGARPLPEARGFKPDGAMRPDGDFSKWDDVSPEFRNHRGTTLVERDCDGYDGTHYVNRTGRNNIVRAKAACDSRFVYFYAETAQALTPSDGPAWMQLFINTGTGGGWEGYSHVINRVSPSKTAVIEAAAADGSWNWSVCGGAEYFAAGNKLELAVPREVLGIAEGAPVDIQFKWWDNMQEPGNLADVYSSGNSAPSWRFNYRYVCKP